MPLPPACHWLDVEQFEQVTVARFLRPVLLEGADAETIAEQLEGLVIDAGCCRLVIDFHQVEALSSAMLGRLISLHKKALPRGGRLAICRVAPEVQQILDTVKLSLLIGIYENEHEAVQSFLTTI